VHTNDIQTHVNWPGCIQVYINMSTKNCDWLKMSPA